MKYFRSKIDENNEQKTTKCDPQNELSNPFYILVKERGDRVCVWGGGDMSGAG